MLDRILARDDIQADLEDALAEYFKKSPIRFFRQIIMPLLPHETKLRFDAEGVVQWQSLLTICHTPASNPSTLPEATVSEPYAVEGASAKPCALPEKSSTGAAEKKPATMAGLPPPTTSPNAE